MKPGPGYLVRAHCRGQDRGPEAYRAWAVLLTGGMEADSRDVLEAEGQDLGKLRKEGSGFWPFPRRVVVPDISPSRAPSKTGARMGVRRAQCGRDSPGERGEEEIKDVGREGWRERQEAWGSRRGE